MIAQLDDISACPFKCSHKVFVIVISKVILYLYFAKTYWKPLDMSFIFVRSPHTVSVAIDRKCGIKITTTSTCCKIVIPQPISTRIRRHVELFVAVVTIEITWKSFHGKMSKFIFTVNIEVTILESAEFRRNMTSFHDVTICCTYVSVVA